MVDTLVSGASASRRVGSTPIIRTKRGRLKMIYFSLPLFLMCCVLLYVVCNLLYETFARL